jgi:hypothetical protein
MDNVFATRGIPVIYVKCALPVSMNRIKTRRRFFVLRVTNRAKIRAPRPAPKV